MTVMIAVPTFENIMPDTFKSLWDMDKNGEECVFEFVRGYDCARARAKIGEKALAMGVSHVLMVDSDVVVPKDALSNLMSHHNSVVLGFYAHRDAYNGKTCLCKTGRKNFDRQYTAQELRNLREAGMYKIEIKGGGLGCALIETHVFEQTPYPWFKFLVYDDGHGVLSEDLYFCHTCTNNGIPVYADTRVACGHFFRHRQNVE